MALPASRNTTYAVGSQVEADDLNDLQDCIIQGAHGDRSFSFAPGPTTDPTTTWTNEGTLITSTSTTGTNVYIPRLQAGDRIKSVAIEVKGDGVADLTWSVYKVAANFTATLLPGSGATVTNPAASPFILSTDTPTAYTLQDREYLFILLDPNAAGIVVGMVTVTYDHPLA